MNKRKFISPAISLVMGLVTTAPGIISAQETTPNQGTTTNESKPLTLSGKPITLHEVALMTLANSADIENAIIGVNSAWAGYMGAQSQFDTYTSLSGNTNQHRASDVTVMGPDINSRGLSLGVNKQFRTGISGGLSVSSNRTDMANMSSDASNSGGPSVNLTIPLLKGRGYVSAAAGETQARLSAEAAEYGFYHSVSGILLGAVSAYWDYKAATERLKIRQAGGQRVKQWLTGASGDSSQTSGYLADKQKGSLAASEEVSTTRGALANIMGVPFDQLNRLGNPAEVFPEDWSGVLAMLERNPMLNIWVQIAMNERPDLKATKLREESAAVALAKAEQDILPQLNLGLTYAFNGVEKGDSFSYQMDALTSGDHTTDTGASLSFSYPLENRGARSARELARLSHRSSVIATNNGTRQVGVDVSVAADKVLGRLKTVVEAKQAVESYLPAMRNLGKSSTFDIIDLDERLSKAEDDYVNSLRELAKAIGGLRHQTGTLVTGGKIGKDVMLGELTKLPTADAGKEDGSKKD